MVLNGIDVTVDGNVGFTMMLLLGIIVVIMSSIVASDMLTFGTIVLGEIVVTGDIEVVEGKTVVVSGS